MAPPCPSRRDTAVIRRTIPPWWSGKMAATVSANSSAVLWVCVHFHEWTIAWQGPRRRERLSRGVSNVSASLVSHDISYETRSSVATIVVPRRALSAVTANLRGSRRRHGDDDYLAVRESLPPLNLFVIFTRGLSLPSVRTSRTCISRSTYAPVCANAPAEVRCPLRSALLDVTHWQRLSPVPDDVTDTTMTPAVPQHPGRFPDPGLINTYLPIYVTDFAPVLSHLSILSARYICLETTGNTVKFL